MLSKIDNYEVSISHTTRQPRPNEINDKDYYYLYCNFDKNFKIYCAEKKKEIPSGGILNYI